MSSPASLPVRALPLLLAGAAVASLFVPWLSRETVLPASGGAGPTVLHTSTWSPWETLLTAFSHASVQARSTGVDSAWAGLVIIALLVLLPVAALVGLAARAAFTFNTARPALWRAAWIAAWIAAGLIGLLTSAFQVTATLLIFTPGAEVRTTVGVGLVLALVAYGGALVAVPLTVRQAPADES